MPWGVTGLRVDVLFLAHAFDVNVQVKFAHALDDGLAAFLIDFDVERRVFLVKRLSALERVRKVVAVLGFDDGFDDRLGTCIEVML